jgi:uncharacterized protein YcnI
MSSSARTLVYAVARRPARALALAFGALLVVLLPTILFGHAVVYPKASAPGAYERYVLRVPNEKGVATTRVEIRFPDSVRVSSFADVPGWQLQVLTDSAKRVIGAVWTGALPPQRFVELPFVAVNPKSETRLTWPVIQTYADGERVAWTEQEGAKTPASVTNVSAGGMGAADESAVRWVPWIALALAVVSLGLALRRPETNSVP